MYEIIPKRLWLGNTGDLLKPALLELAGIQAVVQVALAEQLPSLSREMLVAHFPITDGPGNSRGMIAAAVELTAVLIQSGTPILICCSAGMSRSPSIAAGALALAKGHSPDEALKTIIDGRPHDISPAVWEAVLNYVQSRQPQ